MPAFLAFRYPHDLLVQIEEPPRQQMMENAAREITLRGRPPHQVVAWGERWKEVLELDAVVEQEPTAHFGLTLDGMRARPGVERCFLSVGLREGGQDRVVLVEPTPEGAGYWTASLAYQNDTHTGVGLHESDWQITEPKPLSELPEALHALLAPFPGARGARVEAIAPPEPEIGTWIGRLPPTAHTPTRLELTTKLALEIGQEFFHLQGMRGHLVIVFRGREMESWQLGSHQPASIDEMVRLIANRPPLVTSVALVCAATVYHEGRQWISLRSLAEQEGSRQESHILMESPQGLQGQLTPVKAVAKAPEPVTGEEGWIGVRPLVFFRLVPA